MNDHLPAIPGDQNDLPAPGGDGTLQERIARLQAEVAAMTSGDAGALATGSELVALGQVPAEVAREHVAKLRASALKKTSEIKALQAELRAELEAQIFALNKTMEPLLEQARVAKEKVWTLNLYLGRDEEIVQLLSGDPAPAETTITLRQQVLSMDEETAAHADQGGIDARHIEVFDDWIRDPAHLQQVFPEPKGVVVLVPRRRGRDYKDPWLQREMDRANQWSYFLIRNGDNLYRMKTDFVVGRHLIPTTTEFTGLFRTREFNRDTKQYEMVDILPGTREWGEAEKSQDARQRHYMRMALVLQGLADRTVVWHPLPTGRVNLLSNDTYENGTAELVRDAEHLLTDGREDFYPWLSRLNAQLRPGMRILGAFRTDVFKNAGEEWSESHSRGRNYYPNKRISPVSRDEWGADKPRDAVIYRIEGKRTFQGEPGWYFKFTRGKRWMRDRDTGREVERTPKTKGTCVILPDDRFVLPYDLVTVEELRYYLGSRRQRHAYEHMFPLLHAAIAAKEAEAAEEAPFRDLLAGELIQVDDTLTLETATGRVDELVHWWKFTNKHHRALNGEPEHEAKAIRAIVAEHLARTGASVAQFGDEAAEATMVRTLLAHDDTIMAIARKRDGGYLAFAPQPRAYPAGTIGLPAKNATQGLVTEAEIAANAKLHPVSRRSLADMAGDKAVPAAVADNVYAIEYTTTKTGRTIKRRDWIQPGTRLDGLRVLHATKDWEGWDFHASANDHLTDPEIEDAVSSILTDVEALAGAGWAERYGHRNDKTPPFTPVLLGVCLRTDGSAGDQHRFELHLISDALPEPARRAPSANGHTTKLSYGEVCIPFTKTARDGVVLHRADGPRAPWPIDWSTSRYGSATPDRPWHYHWGGKAKHAIAVVTFPENGRVALEQAAAVDAYNAEVKRLGELARQPLWPAKRAWEARAEAQAYARFLEDYADPELWEDHKKNLRGLEAHLHPHGRGIPPHLLTALGKFIDEGRSFEGHTIASLLEACDLPATGVGEDLLDLPLWEAPVVPDETAAR